jgi:3-methyladenine DNA glycosylase AlkD
MQKNGYNNPMKIQTTIRALANPKKAKDLQWFFKTGKGQYGEGDVFLGVVVPKVRALVKQFPEASLKEVETLLSSKYHEERMLGLLILVSQFEKGEEHKQKEIYTFYLNHTKYINNWDLVDLSALYIVGAYLHKKEKTVLVKLAKSNSMWERRISILSTFYDIRNGDPKSALLIAEMLIHDTEDLIHKAVGWMLREVGKRCSQDVEEKFLRSHYKTMPRTMLRYAIEHFEEGKRKKYLAGTI